MVRMLKRYCFSCHALTNFRCCIMSGDSVDREPGWPKWEAHGLYVKSLIEPGSNLLCPTLAYFLHFEKALGLYVKSLVDPGSDLLCPTFFILKKVLGLYVKKNKKVSWIQVQIYLGPPWPTFFILKSCGLLACVWQWVCPPHVAKLWNGSYLYHHSLMVNAGLLRWSWLHHLLGFWSNQYLCSNGLIVALIPQIWLYWIVWSNGAILWH